MEEVKTGEIVVTLEDIAAKTTKALDLVMESALHHIGIDAPDVTEIDIKNALLLAALLRDLGNLRAMRG